MNWKRELRKILYKYRSRIHGCVWDLSMPCRLTDPEKINFCIESIAKFNEKEANALKSIVTEYNITYDVFEKHFGLDLFKYPEWQKLYLLSSQYRNPKVYRERHDNKLYYHYSSDNPSHSGNYVRYPSKKRSLRTWRNFYNLFPWLAVADGWDGKKSSRYP